MSHTAVPGPSEARALLSHHLPTAAVSTIESKGFARYIAKTGIINFMKSQLVGILLGLDSKAVGFESSPSWVNESDVEVLRKNIVCL
jgi:hypothetical protein